MTRRVGLTTICTFGLCCSGWSASSESRARFATTSLRTVASLGIAIALPLAGCFLSPIPDLRGPTDFAREMIPRCESFSEESSERVRADSLVEAVEPAYVFVPAGPLDRQAQLSGARLHLRPMNAVSRESLQRSLECHQARVVLGTHAPTADDPFALPAIWLDIDVQSEGDGFVVNVRAQALRDARRVLDHARLFFSATRR